MVRFPLNSRPKIIKKWLDFTDKKDCNYGQISIKFKVKKTLKQWLDFSDKKGLQLWSDFHQIQAKTSLKQGLDFPDKKKNATMVGFA